MNLQELRDAVRNQLDLDEDDVPNSTLDLWIRDGYQESINTAQHWPFFQATWDVEVDGDSDGFVRPANLSSVSALLDVETGERLWQIGHEAAEDAMLGRGGGGRPMMFSVWGDFVWLWPRPLEPRNYRLRGYRAPVDWVSNGAGAEVDADVRLHSLIAHYACARAYAQLEDDVLEQIYRQQWLASLDNARRAIIRPDVGTPIILNGGLGAGLRASARWRLQP